MTLKTLKSWLAGARRRSPKTTSWLPRRWRLQLEALEDRLAPTATPTAILTAPASALIGTHVNLSVDFRNASPTDAGYGPYVDVVLPATGEDGNDGLSYASGSGTYLGTAVTTTVLTFDAQGHATHPYARDASGHLVIVNGTPGDQLVVFQLPFGSFTPGQPDAIINFQANLSNLADLNVPLTIQTDGGFQYGDSATGATSVLGSVSSNTLDPTLFTVTKTYIGPEDETATGPNYVRQYEVDVSVAPGQTISNFKLQDQLPGNIQFVSVDTATANGGLLTASTLPSTTTPGGLLQVTFSKVVGTGGTTDAKLLYSFYVPRDPSGTDTTQTPDLPSGGFTPSPNSATGSGTWTPIDPRDATTAVSNTSNTVTLTEKSIAIQKGVADVNGNPTNAVAVGDDLQYTLNFQVSDYFAFQNLVATDLFSDGQNFDAGFTPTLTVTEHGVTHSVNFSAGGTYVLGAQSSADGSDLLTFDVSQALIDGGFSGQLLGGSIPAGGTGGAEPNKMPSFGATTATITFRTTVQQQFDVQQSLPTHSMFVKAGDSLGDKTTVTGDVLDYADLTDTGTTRSDNSAASVSLAQGALTKTIYAIDGQRYAGSGKPLVAPGDTVTYELTYTLPHTNADNQSITDYLPLPVFSASQFLDSQTNMPVSVGAYAGNPPAAGQITLGPNDTYLTIRTGFTPSVSLDTTANSVTLTYGTYHDAGQDPSTIDLLLTVTVSDDPFVDGLFLTNEAHESEQSVNDTGVVGTVINDSSSTDSIVQIQLTEPNLSISKGVVATNDSQAAVSFSPTPVGPVSFSAPGSAGFRGSGTINSNGLTAHPIDSNLSNIQANDTVTFAVVIQNIGHSAHGAFNVAFQDTLPSGFHVVGNGNLRITDGAGNPLAFTKIGGGAATINDLFGNGVELVDGTQGASGAYNATNGSNIAVITYDLVADTADQPLDSITNTATLLSYASVPNGPNYVFYQHPERGRRRGGQVSGHDHGPARNDIQRTICRSAANWPRLRLRVRSHADGRHLHRQYRQSRGERYASDRLHVDLQPWHDRQQQHGRRHLHNLVDNPDRRGGHEGWERAELRRDHAHEQGNLQLDRFQWEHSLHDRQHVRPKPDRHRTGPERHQDADLHRPAPGRDFCHLRCRHHQSVGHQHRQRL
jgi:uncharacterized repeat protein (TIGR01451 family)